MLEGEMDGHLGYERYERSDEPNYRNGTKQKHVRSKYGEFEEDVPQDRQSPFEPQVLPKRKKDISAIDDKMLFVSLPGLSKSLCKPLNYGTDLKRVYAAPTEETALNGLELFRDQWDAKYPKIYKSWHDNWAALSTYFKYPEAVRCLIYTTNAMEGFNRQDWGEIHSQLEIYFEERLEGRKL